MTTERITSPLLGSTFVCVQREVLAEMLRFIDMYGEFEWPRISDRQRIYDLGQAVEAGTLDHIDAATWRGGRGEAGE